MTEEEPSFEPALLLPEVSPHFKGTTFRIYRDTRFAGSASGGRSATRCGASARRSRGGPRPG